MGRNLNDFYRRLQNPNGGGPAQFELASPYRFNVDIAITKPVSNKIANNTVFNGEHLSLAVRGIDVPDVAGSDDPSVETHTGYMSMPDNTRKYTASNEVTIKFINSVFAPHENFFFNWLRETRSFTWQYDDYPFSKANIYVVGYPNSDSDFIENTKVPRDEQIYTDFSGSPIVKYQFIDAFPTGIETMNFDHALADQAERSITFRFNYMTVNGQKLEGQGFRDNKTDSASRQIAPVKVTQNQTQRQQVIR